MQLTGTPQLAFVVQLLRTTENGLRDAGFAFHFACEVSGHICPQDPDDLVLSAHWKEVESVLDLLSVHTWYDSEPLRHWLSGDADAAIVYTHKIASNT
ncbi:hypothetical protein KDH_25740 [Dictyobacter sp. S3.2.2.5]|uniref:ABM domain-containing protein n=1 Tax=Dictyobacter halimunensis TaxID=3026934 RepID=A0ABQ6FPX0_9CHLR|nr:hypothetical protein KDH_25740 [Dictyobacter sp. S3.2.2.5]